MLRKAGVLQRFFSVIIATETLPLCGSPVVFGISVRSTERANYKALSPVRAQIHTHTHTFFFFFFFLRIQQIPSQPQRGLKYSDPWLTH